MESKIFRLLIMTFFIGIFLNFNEYTIVEKNVVVEIYKLKKEVNPNKLKNKNFEKKLIFGVTKNDEIDFQFLKRIKKIGFRVNKVSDENHREVEKLIDSKKTGKNYFDTACKKIFRDLIVYKQDNEIIKVVKICTSCYANEIITKNGESELILTFEDYDNLEKYLE